MLYTPRSEERNTAWFKMAWHSTLAAHSAPGHSDRAQSYLYCRINCRLTLVDTCGAVEHLCETLPGRFEVPSPPPTNTHTGRSCCKGQICHAELSRPPLVTPHCLLGHSLKPLGCICTCVRVTVCMDILRHLEIGKRILYVVIRQTMRECLLSIY